MKKTILLLSFCCIVCLAQGQYFVNYKRVADLYFQNKEYYAASTFYKKALNITSDTTLAMPYFADVNKKTTDRKAGEYEAMMFNLAEASRLYKNFKDAEQYYAIAANFTDKNYATARYWYGVSLRANQKYDEASVAIEKFLKENPGSALQQQASLELASAKFAAVEMKNPRLVQLKKLHPGINSEGSNYAPLYASNLYFTSSRPVKSEGNTKVIRAADDKDLPVSKRSTPYLNMLYVSNPVVTEGEAQVKQADIKRPAGVEFAAATLSPDGNTMYFTAWRTEDVVKKYEVWYTQKKGEGGWSDPVVASSLINASGTNSKQPFVTGDGKFLLFSSDRAGGSGKYDLWYCAIRPDGSTGQALNLGPDVNSAGDEEAPYYNMISRKLRYSSNGMVGLGGFDFFESQGDFTKWSKPVNMGYPFNSSKDDIYFAATNSFGSEGYISSDRESLCCLELFSVSMETISIKGVLIDCKSGKPIPNATVTLTSEEDNYTASTNEAGVYSFKVTSRRPIGLKFEAPEFFAKTTTYSAQELAKADTLINSETCLVPFKVNVPIVLKNIYFEFNSAELNDDSKATLDGLVKVLNDNEKIKIELSAHTDALGSDVYNLDLSEKRAQSCVTYLITSGIAADRLTAKGYGETMPIAPNQLASGADNPEGRQLNRRIEFKVTGDKDVVK